MTQAKFSLTWDTHKSNLSNGLSALQQNGEFVDMTLAADGHLVKVHQVIIALASPYLKHIMASAPCPHPVLILNKLSFTSLCSILEYIYTGEVIVARENLPDLMQAAKELQIRGLEDMKVELADETQKECDVRTGNKLPKDLGIIKSSTQGDVIFKLDNNKREDEDTTMKSYNDDQTDQGFDDSDMDQATVTHETDAPRLDSDTSKTAQVSYTLSNHGALQMILNRYMYYLRYTSRKGGSKGHRQWRCINYCKERTKCQASVVTRDDIVVRRCGAHNHPFHDQKILKKVHDKAVFTTLLAAEYSSAAMKQKKKTENLQLAKTQLTDGDIVCRLPCNR